MSVWLITHHQGALEWAAQQNLHADKIISRLGPESVQPGNTVITALPVYLAAEVCSRGVRYLHLGINIPSELRGEELNLEQMTKLGATLNGYKVEKS